MKCPYNRKSETIETTEQTNADENSGVYTTRIVVTKTTFEMMDCTTQCAKYRNGECTM